MIRFYQLAQPYKAKLVIGAWMALWGLGFATSHSAVIATSNSEQAVETQSTKLRLTPDQRRQRHEEELKRRHERLKERRSEFENRLFEEVDENNDGTISKSEFRKRADRRFQELDLNRDGKLSRDELRQERPGPRRP
jgi:hypothetical protein